VDKLIYQLVSGVLTLAHPSGYTLDIYRRLLRRAINFKKGCGYGFGRTEQKYVYDKHIYC